MQSTEPPNQGVSRYYKRKRQREADPDLNARYKSSQRESRKRLRARGSQAKSTNAKLNPSPQLATNRELIEMMVLWENLHPSTRQQHGLKVFQKLSQIPPESLPTLDVTFSTLPTPAHLVRDLFADDDVQYRSCLTGRNEGNIVDFFAGWNALADNPSADINYRIQAPYIAVGVKASKNGLLDCEIEMPDVLRRSDVYVSPVTHGEKVGLAVRNDPPLFHSIITPAGTITDIHDDSVISGSFLVQLYGYKVLLSWPGSPINREFFKDCHGTDHDLRLLEAIERMSEGLKVTILKPGIGVELLPGMIHAVLSPTNSAIGCWEYVNAQWLDSNEIKEGGLWELKLLAKRAAAELPSDEKTEDMYRQLSSGIDLWECLKERLVDDSDEDAGARVEQIQNLISLLIPQIPERNVRTHGVKTSKTGVRGYRKK